MNSSCARGHQNHPAAKYCGICGLAMVQASVLASAAQRGVIGDTDSDTGSTAAHLARRAPLGGALQIGRQRVDLGELAVIGRTPERSDDVVQGRALPVQLEPPGVSGIHASIRVVGWQHELCDLGSTNGTFVWDHRSDAWHRVAEPVLIADGAVLCFGSTEAVFLEAG